MNTNKTIIIAEAGINHNGSIKLAKKLINAAKKAGADFIKFQAYNSSDLTTKDVGLTSYQSKFTRKKISQYELLKKFEFNKDDFQNIVKHCKFKKIKFIASPFDLRSIDMLIQLGASLIKIPSGEITNLPYLKHLGKYKKEIILSSGMSELKEIKLAINILTKAGTSKNKITVLHCNSEYPTPIEDVNLKAMQTIKDTLNIKVGYSDHSNNIEVPISAVALGATIIEKHLTLDRNMLGPDHKSSLEPKSFFKMVENIRNTEKILGSELKQLTNSEKNNILIVRKSIVAAKNIKKGEKFTINSLSMKRPGNGISPMKLSKIIGKMAKKNYKIDEQIKQ